MFWIVLLNAFFASTFTIGKAALNTGVSPIFFIGLRMGIAGVCLLAYWYLFGLKQDGHIRKNIKGIILYSLVGIAGSYLIEFWILTKITSIKSSLIFNLSPFISALLSYFMLKEKMDTKRWIGLSIGFLGFIPLVLYSPQASSILTVGLFDCLMLVSAFAYTYGWVQMRALVKNGMSPIWVNGVAMLFTGVVSTLIPMGTGTIGSIPSWTFLLALVIAIVIAGNIIAYIGLGFLLKRYTATFITLSGLIRPIFAAFYGYIFLTEVITWHFFASMACVCVGLYIFYKQESSKIAI
ncbi:DMT family transporter [bacterium]|jgi:drug/metabolite transporter (DMT)-like permease|nr:DMT family transporter [bacterium]